MPVNVHALNTSAEYKQNNQSEQLGNLYTKSHAQILQGFDHHFRK